MTMFVPNAAVPSSSLELRHASTDHAIFVVVPERRFLAIGGVGGPMGSDFAFAAAALRVAAEVLGRRLRRHGASVPIRVPTLESLWTPPAPLAPRDVPAAFADRSRWTWCQLIELPAAATHADVEAAVDETRRGAGRDVALIRELRFAEGLAAQVLHVGPVETDPASVTRLFAAVDETGLEPAGWLHVINLSSGAGDRRRAILRQPVEAVPSGVPAVER